MVTVEKVYSATWCGDCIQAEAFLKKHEIQYEKIDVNQVPQAWAEIARISGDRCVPLVVFSDGSFLVEPTDEQLGEKLGLE